MSSAVLQRRSRKSWWSGSVGDHRVFGAAVFGRYGETGDSRRRDEVQRPRWQELGVSGFIGFLSKTKPYYELVGDEHRKARGLHLRPSASAAVSGPRLQLGDTRNFCKP